MRRKLNHLIGGLLALTICACDVAPDTEEAQVALNPDGQALLADVSGAWRLVGTRTDDCPEQASVPFPLGDTRWTDEAGSLVVTGLGAEDVTMTFSPLDGSTFIREITISWAGCEATQHHILQIDGVSDVSMSGVFSAVTEVDLDGPCGAEARSAGLPCESQVTWTALRI